MSELIKDRPEVLEKLPFYNELPQLPVGIDIASTVHDFLKFDIDDLDGLQPIEEKYLAEAGRVFGVHPSEELISIYERNKIDFQLINVIVNLYGFEEKDNTLIGKPYSISLKPTEKRGKVTKHKPAYFRNFNMENLRSQDLSYIGFNPFTQSYVMFGHYSTFISQGCFKTHSDMVGFVLNTYALATKWDFNEICLPGMPGCNQHLRTKFKKYRTRRYFKKFDSIRPRKVWGCDSPIELFLLQAMDVKGLFPEIQTALFEDGSSHPTLHQMITANSKECEIRQITDADFYFPEKKLAVFCDSNAHHRSKKAKDKDTRIDGELKDLGIDSLRIMGTDIVNDPYRCVDSILEKL
ncbi:endonuclease domain-containing protein [Motiliproteus sp. MSK22-1]|uniref:endonuclease domain-containing protein n=1 Tax=Motiliproteus sp. MSK22-1 TaxID=1897630 RepID=UPI0009779894|nr:hypothetical protein [Motiliproteus sp. MSK22-1]OMH30218.1 hypothetical protein BGP75_17640 [Motiliproteus sp. MSK22-1]